MRSLTPPFVDWSALLDHRAAAFRRVLERSELDAIVLGLWDNVRYASGFEGSTSLELNYEGFIGVFEPGGCHVLSLWEEQQQDEWLDPVEGLPHLRSLGALPAVWPLASIANSAAEKLASQLQELGATRVGIDALPSPLFQELKRLLPGLELTPVLDELFAVRAVKHSEEVRLIEAGAAALDAAALTGLDAIHAGAPENEVAAAIASAMFNHGAEMISHIIVGSSARPAQSAGHLALAGLPATQRPFQGSAYPTRAPIAHGESARIDIGLFGPGGYCTDIARAAVCGTPSPQLTDVHARLIDAYHDAASALRPGLPVADHDRAFRKRLADAGLGDYGLSLGHGIGMRMVEPPSLTPPHMLDDGSTFEAGMVICQEVHLEPDGHPLSVEDMWLVTKSGCLSLNRIPYDLT